MENNELTATSTTMVIPTFGSFPEQRFELKPIRDAESRLQEASQVNPSNYSDLELTFNQAYRALKSYVGQTQYSLDMAEKQLELTKSTLLLDEYPAWIAEFTEKNKLNKSFDTAETRKAYLMKNEDYVNNLDRIAQLKAVIANFEGKIKVFERACAAMKKQMDLLIRSGISGSHLYVTGGKK